MLLRRKSTKNRSQYDPEPYLVVRVSGSQIEGLREGGSKIRDAQKWKKYAPFVGSNADKEDSKEDVRDSDIGYSHKQIQRRGWILGAAAGPPTADPPPGPTTSPVSPGQGSQGSSDLAGSPQLQPIRMRIRQEWSPRASSRKEAWFVPRGWKVTPQDRG